MKLYLCRNITIKIAIKQEINYTFYCYLQKEAANLLRDLATSLMLIFTLRPKLLLLSSCR